jgi:hypothetical protein
MIEELFRWLGHTPVGLFMRDSTWGFATVETLHLLGLAALGGTVLVAGLSAAGLLLRDTDPARVARGVRGVGLWALGVLVVSGVLLVSSKPVRYYLDNTFRTKMLLLVAAIAVSVAVARRLPGAASSPLTRTLAVGGLLLWLSVGVAGRIIGFL